MKNFDRFFQKIYEQPLENRQDWYAESTVAYAKYRAPYIDEIIDQTCRQFDDIAQPHLLEIGSGPGNATKHFVERGYKITCVEPNTTACKFAIERFKAFPNVEIINSTFEEWSANISRTFDVAIAGTSFHWLDQKTRCERLANLLKSNGKIILLWCTAPQPEYEIYQYLDPIYQEYLPSFADYENFETQRQNIMSVSEHLVESNYFVDLQCQQETACLSYTTEEYLSLLTTLSPYIALSTERREAFFTTLRQTFEENEITKISTKYICAAHSAIKAKI
ncbi:Methyltransferase type 12 [[Leptolyngbya] sp. PCC 7376]|uniref:class I SAM-dependent methyltransferase n=1 Tax=[Leptolyngbya] sp. PCC 7376 TaxID=111781 RepID=UPI00029F1490|nr:class I SAM-dependent methyltransferase [[Leptolyngbya] sp. PCC 7376]AFY39202.1 Methyltransferase type 12 [[Leptolyngbya] sp. PCC 7376]